MWSEIECSVKCLNQGVTKRVKLNQTTRDIKCPVKFYNKFANYKDFLSWRVEIGLL